METKAQNIEFTKGDTYTFELEFNNGEQQLDSCYLTCRDGRSIKDTLLFQLSIGDGIEEEIIVEEPEQQEQTQQEPEQEVIEDNEENTEQEETQEQETTNEEEPITKYKYNFRIAPEKTQNLEDGIYFYDIQIGIDNDIYTTQKGKLKLTWEVTSISEENE